VIASFSKSAGAGTAVLVPIATLIGVSGLNYAYFLTFARILAPNDFTGFTTATAILMPSVAVAEAGSIYAAPPFLRARTGTKAGRVAGAFCLLSLLIFASVASAGSVIWNLTADDSVGLAWLGRCIVLTLPNLLLQTWLTVRVRKPILYLVLMCSIRAVPLLFMGSLQQFDLALIASAALLVPSFYIITSRVSRALLIPHSRDFAISLRLIRQFFVLRVFSTIVTSSAPMILGALSGTTAAAAYLLGDRVRALVSSAFQPLLQGMYFMVCRSATVNPRHMRSATVVLLFAVALSALVLMTNVPLLNQLLFAGRHPDVLALSLFVLAGHVSVLSAIGYFLFLIPRGRSSAFIRGGVVQGCFFTVAIVSVSTFSPIRLPAAVALCAELLLMVIVWITIFYYRRSALVSEEPVVRRGVT